MRGGVVFCVVLGCSCGFDSGGVGSGSGSGNDTDSGEGSTSTASGSAEVTSGGSAEGEVTSSDPSASGPDPSTTGNPSTTGDPSTTASNDTGPADTGPGTTTATTNGNTTDDTTTGGSGVGYPACPSGDDSQCRPGYNCIPILDQFNNILSSFCGDMDCDVDSDCDAPADGNATPECLQFSTPVCTLTCNFGEACPTGMDCIDTQAGWLCAWP